MPVKHFIGIDLAWVSGNPSGAAVIDSNARFVAYQYCLDVQEIIHFISEYSDYPHAVVGVDAPLIIPNATGHRPNEHDFLKTFARYGLGVHAANTTLFEKRFARYAGFELYGRLQDAGYDFGYGNLYEVYPHATILALFNDNRVLRYKASVPKTKRVTALKQLQTALFEVITIPNALKTDIETLKGKALKAEEDFLDSLVCAYTLLYCTHHDCHCFGNDAIGKLLTPLPN